MLKKFRIPVITLCLTIFSGLLLAQPADGPSFYSDRILKGILDLSEEQLEALQQLKEDFQATVEPLREEGAAAHEALAAELDSEDPAAVVVGELILQIHALNGEVEQAKQDFVSAFEALLTPEQLEKLEELRERRRQRAMRDRIFDGQGRPGIAPTLLRILDLSEEQAAQLEDLQAELQATVEPLAQERQELAGELEALLESEAPDAEEVGRLAIAIHGINQQIGQARQDFFDSFQAILTPEQLEKLQRFLEDPRRGSRGRPGRSSRGR